jgi:hypothetical protein
MLGRLFYFLLKTYFHVILGIMLGPLFYSHGNKSLGGSKPNGLTWYPRSHGNKSLGGSKTKSLAWYPRSHGNKSLGGSKTKGPTWYPRSHCDLGYHVRPFVLLPPKDLFPCDLGYHAKPFVLLPPKDLFPCDLGYHVRPFVKQRAQHDTQDHMEISL